MFIVIELAMQTLAKKRYEEVCSGFGERLVSGSDDFTLFLWKPETEKKPLGIRLLIL